MMAKCIYLLPCHELYRVHFFTFMFGCLLFHLIFNIKLHVAVRNGQYHLFCFQYDTDTFKGQYCQY